ncbi:YybH family protein [Martelella alba]|nr:DUF4440 domain-containing protein [Martelella alba]
MKHEQHDPEEVMVAYGRDINLHDFDRIAGLISADATFWFTDGTHHGLHDIRAAFETNWRQLEKEIYGLQDLAWVARGRFSACCTYRFFWTAEINGNKIAGGGLGTTVLRREDDGLWRIIHEHLSKAP